MINDPIIVYNEYPMKINPPKLIEYMIILSKINIKIHFEMLSNYISYHCIRNYYQKVWIK